MDVYRDVRDEVGRCHLSEEEAFQRTRALRESMLEEMDDVRRAFGWIELREARVEPGHPTVEATLNQWNQTKNALN